MILGGQLPGKVGRRRFKKKTSLARCLFRCLRKYKVHHIAVCFIAYKIPKDEGRQSHGDYILSVVSILSPQTVSAQTQKKNILEIKFLRVHQ